MKVLKNFTLFVIYPATLIVIGFIGGVTCMRFFYPGSYYAPREDSAGQLQAGDIVFQSDVDQPVTGENVSDSSETSGDSQTASGTSEPVEEMQEASAVTQRLNANTSYVLEETDLRNDTVVETTWKLPTKYIGMDREQFIEAMEIYEAAPPLFELQKGFVSLDVLSFSPQKVVVQMNYEYEPPVTSYYLKVENNYVAVYLDDMVTLYMDTDICLKDLPEELQQEIIQVLYVPDEESLYDFLENYSS